MNLAEQQGSSCSTLDVMPKAATCGGKQLFQGKYLNTMNPEPGTFALLHSGIHLAPARVSKGALLHQGPILSIASGISHLGQTFRVAAVLWPHEAQRQRRENLSVPEASAVQSRSEHFP